MNLIQVREYGKQLKQNLALYRRMMGDQRTPRTARFLLWLAIGYTLMPFDLIPDFIPVLGQVDDVLIVPLLVILALRLVPEEVKRDYRERSRTDLRSVN